MEWVTLRTVLFAGILIVTAGCAKPETEALANPDVPATSATGAVGAAAPPSVDPSGLADLDIVLELSGLTGKAPLRVDFVANASVADDTANWTVDFGAGGEPMLGRGLPATFNFTFEAAGVFLVNFTAEKGGKTVGSANATITVEPGGPAHGEVLATATTHQTGTILASGAEVDCETFSVDLTWTIEPAVDGVPIFVSHVDMTLTRGPTAVDLDIDLYAPNGDLVGSSHEFTSDEAFSEDGEWPAGDYNIHITSCLAVNGGYTVDGTATLAAI